MDADYFAEQTHPFLLNLCKSAKSVDDDSPRIGLLFITNAAVFTALVCGRLTAEARKNKS
jgi:hypothetical protein